MRIVCSDCTSSYTATAYPFPWQLQTARRRRPLTCFAMLSPISFKVSSIRESWIFTSMEAATAFSAIRDAMETISVFMSSSAFFFSSSISPGFARSTMRFASSLASAKISASCFSLFSSLRRGDFLRLFVDGLYFILILCFQRERIFAACLCRFRSPADPFSSFSSASRAGLKRKYDITKNRDKILIPVITMSLIH